MKKTYLVTGAAGFIGGVLARKLVDQGHTVWTIDNLSTGFKENVPDGVHLIQGGCQEPESIAQLEGKAFDAILHFAGQSSGEISFDDPVYDLRTNTESTLRLIKYGLENGCPRFIYSSSMSVYGDVPNEPIAEDWTPQPLSFYGIGKLASEHYLRIYQSKGLQATSLRLFNVYGEGQNMSNLRQGMVSIFLAQLLKEDKIIVKGSNNRFRDFIEVNDVVDITIKMIDEPRSYGKIYNVGTGKRNTVADLLNIMVRESGLDKEIVYAGVTLGDQKGIYADISLIQKEFDFKPQFSLDQGLKNMIEWAKKTKW
ncbi:MAG: NAD-dependent epimerase/dehydratase family protein [Candidatus Omnitrophica bacterium]|nr:NAD-dependent epimerase/dehydratase family protein [Candidatus Omnitrophota bacterium]